MYERESWTVKKAEHWRIDTFELWCWRRLLRVPWTAKRSNQSILMEISPGCSLEGMMLKLKLQYFSHLMRRVDSLEKTLMLGEIGGRRRRGRQRMRWLDGIADSVDRVWVNSRTWSQRVGPGGSDCKASVYNAGDLGSIPGSGRFPGEGNGNPLQYSCLENPMDGGAWCRLLSMGSQRVGHDSVTSLQFTSQSLCKCMYLNILNKCVFFF